MLKLYHSHSALGLVYFQLVCADLNLQLIR
jgi:hypothetical protein